MNCLEYALKFWDKNPYYKIFYNSDHCINLPESTAISNNFLPIEEYGIEYFKGAFELTGEYLELLEKYFNTYKEFRIEEVREIVKGYLAFKSRLQ